MNIFISSSHKDKEYTDLIVAKLKEAGHRIWYDVDKAQHGANIIESIHEGLKKADVLLLVVSQNSLNSSSVLKEFSTIALTQISKGSGKIISVLIDNISMPTYLLKYPYLDLASNFEYGLLNLINSLSKDKDENVKIASDNEQQNYISYKKDIEKLSKALSDGCLTIVCGAGVSIDAGIPAWNELLIQLLEKMMKKISDNNNIEFNKEANEFYRKKYSSALIISKYLKNNLGSDFYQEIRSILYSAKIHKSKTIDAIIDLARPQRERKMLNSIITFNFDSLIEENLSSQQIKFKSIYSEGIKHNYDELPIYHVHGYLPKSNDTPIDANIVFSEDAYHNQFIDPFSWSNLIQLNTLNQNTCLFIGISLNDPNLRRLLDIVNRKNPERHLNHYIIKRLPVSPSKDNKIDELSRFLEEQDANELGLNVIWVNKHSDTPAILNNICYD